MNADDKMSKGRHHLAKRTHCRNGHEFNEQNTYMRSSNDRACRVCQRNRQRRRYHEKIAEQLKAKTMNTEQHALEATAQILDGIESDAAKTGAPFRWSPAQAVRDAAKRLATPTIPAVEATAREIRGMTWPSMSMCLPIEHRQKRVDERIAAVITKHLAPGLQGGAPWSILVEAIIQADEMHLSRCASSEPFRSNDYRAHACDARQILRTALATWRATKSLPPPQNEAARAIDLTKVRVQLLVPTPADPFAREECTVTDIGHADMILTVTAPNQDPELLTDFHELNKAFIARGEEIRALEARLAPAPSVREAIERAVCEARNESCKRTLRDPQTQLSDKEFVDIICTALARLQPQGEKAGMAWLNEKACCTRADCACHGVTRLQQIVQEEAGARIDEQMLLVKACEAIALGEDGWEKLANECPSTMAVANLRAQLIAATPAHLDRDKERLDWLVENRAHITHHEDGMFDVWLIGKSFETTRGKTARESIDAAMALTPRPDAESKS